MIHAVVPEWNTPGRSVRERERLMSAAVSESLAVASKAGLATIGMCLMGSGLFYWPHETAARVIVEAVRVWAGSHDRSSVKQVNKDQESAALLSTS